MTSSDTAPKIGIYIDLWDKRSDGSRSTWADIREMAIKSEQQGFDSIWVPDRLMMGEVGVWESTTMLAAIAAVTSKVTLGTAVLRSIYRNPTLLAKIVESIEEISGGRLLLGLGAGSNEGDNQMFGYPESYPYSRFEEAFEIVRTLLREGQVDFNGRFYQANETVLRPRGPRGNGPPIMIAALGPRMMRLAALHADYWNTHIVPNTPEEWVPTLEDLDRACEEVGRDPATLKRLAGVLVNTRKGVEHVYGDSVSGEPEAIADRLREFYAAGFEELILWPAVDNAASVDELMPVLEHLQDR